MVSSSASTAASATPLAGNLNAAPLIGASSLTPIEMPFSIASFTTTIEPALSVSATWRLSKLSTIPRDRTRKRGPITTALDYGSPPSRGRQRRDYGLELVSLGCGRLLLHPRCRDHARPLRGLAADVVRELLRRAAAHV